ncbi:MAG: uracil-DNA glycosylase [Treponema sp.]|jgi:DNA polymerase|nr:uracil-DNA glycosylase [Treponema sp.]
MNAETKTTLARFLDLAADYTRSGCRTIQPRSFTGDEADAKIPAGRAADDQAGPPKADSLSALAADAASCARCNLCKGRKNAVPGEGVDRPLVLVVGEAPGGDEDACGRPFVGRAGQQLDRMLDARGKIALSRKTNCFIANVVKCRPPENRNPAPEEARACAPFLARQIKLLRPPLILAAGSVAARALLDTADGVTKLRGRFFDVDFSRSPLYGPFMEGEEVKITVLSTYHPSALLRDPSLKIQSWEDMKLLRARLCELDSRYASLLAPL